MLSERGQWPLHICSERTTAHVAHQPERRPASNESNSVQNGGGNYSSETQYCKRFFFFFKLLECSRVKVTKETWLMDEVPDAGCLLCRKEKCHKGCQGSVGKIRTQMAPWQARWWQRMRCVSRWLHDVTVGLGLLHACRSCCQEGDSPAQHGSTPHTPLL